MILMLAGKARSGKNTLASYLEEECKKRGGKVCQVEVSRSLKAYMRDYFGWDGQDETKPRTLMQNVGTQIIREKLNKPLFHINRLLEDIEILSNFYDDFIIPDIRLPIEIYKIKENYPDSVIIEVTRDVDCDGLTSEERKHLTEVALDDFDEYDYRVHNTTLEELKNVAEKIVREVESNEKNDK